MLPFNAMDEASLAPTALRLHLHGVAAWCGADGLRHPLERKHAALLAWLWLEGPTPRSRLAGLLWPDASEDRARGNLRQRLLKLRQEAGELLQDEAGVLTLRPAVQVAEPEPAGAELLQALEFDDCEVYARWLAGRREAGREARKRQWLAQVREAAATQRLDDALYAADQLLQTDRESEEAYRVLMEVFYLRGDHASALSAWDRCREMLRQLYGVRPSAATQQLGQTLLQAAQQAQAVQQAHAPSAPAGQALPPSVLRPPQLVGRQAAMQALVDGWHARQPLVVAGVAGVGKSRLLAEWQATLGEPRCCAAAAARPGDAVLPYASLSRLLLSAVDRFNPPLGSAQARQAARLLPRLATLAQQAVEPVQTDYERTQALMALAGLLADCVQRGCRAFVLDDLQFADPASLAALRVLAEPARQGHALPFALGFRSDEAGPEVEALLRGLASAGPLTRVDLQALTADEAATLLATLQLPALQAGGWAAAIWRQVGGNPAFLLESVKLLLSSGGQPAADGSLPLPHSIEAVIQRRIELLSPRARHLAQLAAIAGSGYSVALAAAALACAPLELGEPLRELELRQVFYGRQFVHDVIGSVTARSVPPAVAEFMHRFVAEHLLQHGGDAAHIAGHWAACGEWRRAGQTYVQAAQAAAAQALANEQAALLDQAIAAFEREPAAHDELFEAVAQRADVFESAGHESLRPQLIERLQFLARTELQQLSALNFHNGWLVNLARPIEEARIEAAIPRAVALGDECLAWWLSRMLSLHWAMNNRAEDALALLAARQGWIDAAAPPADRASFRQTRSSIFAFGDRLEEAVAEGRLALQAYTDAQDWPNALPAFSNLGVMHYWRGETDAAHAVLRQAREIRERLYGSAGSGIKIDIHLGAVLVERGEYAAAQAMLEGAGAEMAHWPENEYTRTDRLLADNHLAEMFIALGRADEAAAVLAHDATGVADRYYGRRLALRLRWQRVFGQVEPALQAELQALAARLASPFNRALMTLELSRQAAPAEALATCAALADSPVALQRPGLRLHAAALATQAARHAGERAAAAAWAATGRELLTRCAPFDMTLAEAQALLV